MPVNQSFNLIGPGPAPRHAICIGAQKCASTWVFDQVAASQGAVVPAEKELDFFSYRHDRGHAWYRGRFPDRPALRFEASPSYLHDPRAPERAHAFDPAMRIVVTLRDPVERALSHHRHEIARGHIPPIPFRDALADNPDYLEQGFYARHLARWYARFPPDRILVLIAEEIAARPATAARILAHFLDISPAELRPAGERRNVSDLPRSAAFRAATRAGGAAMRRMGLERQLEMLRALPPVRRALSANSRDLRGLVPDPPPAERAALTARFAADLEALGPLIGRRSLPWPSAPADTVPRALHRAQM